MSEPIKKYFVSQLYSHALYTAGALREDIETVLSQEGYTALHTGFNSSNIIKRALAYRKIRTLADEVDGNSLVFFHFPLRSGLNRSLFIQLKDKGVITVAYVHDLEGLRDQDPSELKNEMLALEGFDILIVQNKKMRDLVAKETGKKDIIILGMYDYLSVRTTDLPLPDKTKPVVFAGNLDKASFVQQLRDLPETRFIIYGEGGKAMNALNVLHEGKEDPRLLPPILAEQGGFGLVWDGSSISTGKDEGDYLRYNIPHKLALYIMAGLPILIWNKSAMAEWVLQQKIGITISSLEEINEKTTAITDEQYGELIQNMIPIRDKMAEGFYLRTVLQKMETMLPA